MALGRTMRGCLLQSLRSRWERREHARVAARQRAQRRMAAAEAHRQELLDRYFARVARERREEDELAAAVVRCERRTTRVAMGCGEEWRRQEACFDLEPRHEWDFH